MVMDIKRLQGFCFAMFAEVLPLEPVFVVVVCKWASVLILGRSFFARVIKSLQKFGNTGYPQIFCFMAWSKPLKNIISWIQWWSFASSPIWARSSSNLQRYSLSDLLPSL